MPSLSDNFRMNDLTVALLTETWFNKGNKKIAFDVKTLDQKDNTSLLRRDRSSRGGGVALAFNSNTCDFKKVQLKMLRGSDFEILAAKGKIHGVKKPHLIFTCYVPPSYSSSQTKQFFDLLTDAVSEARSKHPEPWITIGGCLLYTSPSPRD